MKIISNIFSQKTVIVVSALTMTSMSVAPLSGTAFAVQQASNSAFCTNLPTRLNTINSSVSNLSDKTSQAWSQQDQRQTANWQTVDQKVITVRQQADTTRSTNFAKLTARATTDAEKQAVQTYESSVSSTVTTRRSAFDTTRQDFRTGVTSVISTRRSTVVSQLNQFKSSVSSAVSMAEATCSDNSTSGAVARTTLVASLKTARVTFQSGRTGDDKIGPQIQQLAATRKAAFQAAEQTAQSNFTTERTALQNAFKNTAV